MKKIITLITIMSLIFISITGVFADSDNDGFDAGQISELRGFVAATSTPVPGLSIGLVQSGAYSSAHSRLTGLGYSVTLISPDSGLSVFNGYDVIYLPTSWAAAGNGNLAQIEANAADYKAFVNNGGGLLVEQPNPNGQPNGTVTPSLLPYAVTFISSYDLNDLAVIVEPTHEITTGLPANEMPFSADTIPAHSAQYEILVKGQLSNSPSLLTATYGAGRVLIQTAHHSPSASHPFSDEVCIRMFNWVGATPPAKVTITPQTGILAGTQKFDIVLIAQTYGKNVSLAQITFNGADITNLFLGGTIHGSLSAGKGSTSRFPGVSGKMLGVGTHTFKVDLRLDTGEVITDEVTWTVIGNKE